MYILKQVPQTRVELVWDQELAGAALWRTRQLRGALARTFADDDLFHQHTADGKPLYRYPHIQYRWWQGRGIVVGWGEAVTRLLQLPWLDLSLRLGEEQVQVRDALLVMGQATFGVSEQLQTYPLGSPVLLFNQQNYLRYQEMTAAEQRAERDRLLRAQLLIALRGLEVEFTERLYAAFAEIGTVPCLYKQQKLLGVRGTFLCNAVLPAGFAFGHAVSHGYGWILGEQVG